nr:hypothetical transcript [Hymenolepis microstoma]
MQVQRLSWLLIAVVDTSPAPSYTLSGSKLVSITPACTMLFTVDASMLPTNFARPFEMKFIRVTDELKENWLNMFEVVFAFIEERIERGILVHCRKCVVPNSAVAIGYLMWKWRIAFEEALRRVQARRFI